MIKPNENGLHITEGIGGVWFYHLLVVGANATALCGARIMNTSIPIARWGTRGHLNEGWCKSCASHGTDALRATGVQIEATA